MAQTIQKRAAIYIRVSTREQAESGYSVGEQEERLRKYCEAVDMQLAGVFIDPGFSGASLERPALQSMLQAIDAGKVDVVVCWKLDRLSRSQKDTLYLIEDRMQAKGVAFVSTLESFDTGTAFGKAMVGILSVFAQLEREQIKERMQLGLDARAKAGLWHGGGFDPFGYTYRDGRLEVEPDEAECVRFVYDAYAIKRLPVGKIRRLVAERWKTKYGSFASDSSIHSILKTPIYLGLIQWKGELHAGEHAAIISRELWDAAQARMQAEVWKPKNPRQRSPFSHTTLLGGMLFCGHCGARYYAKGNYSGRGERRVYRPYYTCYSRGKSYKSMIVDPECKNPSIAVQVLDARVVAEIKKFALDKKALQALLAERQSAEAVEQRVAELEAERKAITDQIDRLVDLAALGSMPMQTIAGKIEALNADRDRIDTRIKESRADAERTSGETAAALEQFGNVAAAFDHGTFEEQRAVVHSLLSRVVVEHDGSITLEWNF